MVTHVPPLITTKAKEAESEYARVALFWGRRTPGMVLAEKGNATPTGTSGHTFQMRLGYLMTTVYAVTPSSLLPSRATTSTE